MGGQGRGHGLAGRMVCECMVPSRWVVSIKRAFGPRRQCVERIVLETAEWINSAASSPVPSRESTHTATARIE